jgi:copper chaperone CopZ
MRFEQAPPAGAAELALGLTYPPPVWKIVGGGRSPLEKTTYRVPGIHCDHCRRSITQEVEKVRGVTAVDVDLGASTVAVSGSGVDDGAVRRAIAEAGYEAVA